MIQRELPVSDWPVLPAGSILENATDIIINDDFIPALKSNVEFADFYIKRNKKTLFVNVGESWTYGERLPTLEGSTSITSGSDNYCFGSQLLYTFGPLIAKELDSDLYQYAVPGNANINMLVELNRILAYVTTLGYEKIYVSMQITESLRDEPYWVRPYFKSTPLSKLYDDTVPMSFDQWVKLYHSVLMDWYQTTLTKFSITNAIVWSNFCKFDVEKNYSFTQVKPSWIAHSAKLLGVEYQEPLVFNAGSLDPDSNPVLSRNVKVDLAWANDQLDKIDKALTFIQQNKYHNNHPSIEGHSAWAKYLLEQSNWIKNI